MICSFFLRLVIFVEGKLSGIKVYVYQMVRIDSREQIFYVFLFFKGYVDVVNVFNRYNG